MLAKEVFVLFLNRVCNFVQETISVHVKAVGKIIENVMFSKFFSQDPLRGCKAKGKIIPVWKRRK